MTISLKVIAGAIVTTVVLLVGGACIGTSLGTSLDSINKVGEAYALELAKATFDSAALYFKNIESILSTGWIYGKSLEVYPEEYKGPNGSNWTDVVAPFLMQEFAKYNYSFGSTNFVFDSGTWIYNALSQIAPSDAISTEWYEFYGGKTSTTYKAGGRLYSIQNGSRIYPELDPWNRWKGIPHEILLLQIDPFIASLPAFGQLIGILSNKQKRIGKGKPSCISLPPNHIWLPHVNIYFQSQYACIFYNSSDVLLGTMLVSLPSAKTLRGIAEAAPRSKNGHIFIVDTGGQIMATTHPAPWFTSTITTNTAKATAGCSNTYESARHIQPPRMGCRKKVGEFDYEPLRMLPTAVLETTSTAVATVDAGGESFLVVSKRLEAPLTETKMQIVAFVPAKDIFGGVSQGIGIAIGAAVAMLVAGIIAAVVIMVWLLKSLDVVTLQMQETAQLKGLDDEEMLDENDENQNNGGAADGRSKGRSQQNGEHGGNNNNNQHDSNSSASELSWIAEVATLQLAYQANHKAMTNFSRYADKAIVRFCMLTDGSSELHTGVATCMSCDVAGFTTLCEKVEPSLLSRCLCAYFRRVSKLVMAHSGVILMFVGDAVLVSLGNPFPVPRHELLGVLCALAIHRETQRDPLRSIFAEIGHHLAVRIGVSSGNVLAGSMGSSERLQYSVTGEPMTTCNTLEPFSKAWAPTSWCARQWRASATRRL